jgi:hypothetical protein
MIKITELKKRNKLKLLFNIVVSNINESLFAKLGYNFFFEIYQKKGVDRVFIIKNRKKIIGLISYCNKKNEKYSRIVLLKYLFLKPFTTLKVFLNLNFFYKNINFLKNYYQLFHLILLDSSKMKVKNLVERNKMINNLHKKIIYQKYKGIFAAYLNNNKSAHKYYKKNKYIIFKKNKYFSFVKKKF